MNDLFASIEEAKDERQAIKMADGIVTTSEELHRCEIQSVMRRCWPDGKKVAEYFELVESKRGHLAAKKLRDDVRQEWIRRKVDQDKVQK